MDEIICYFKFIQEKFRDVGDIGGFDMRLYKIKIDLLGFIILVFLFCYVYEIFYNENQKKVRKERFGVID